MRKPTRFSILLTQVALLAGLGFIAPSCSQQEIAEPKLQSATEEAAKADKTKTFYGPAVPLGQGVGRAWVMVDANGTPLSIGVELSAKSILNQGPTPEEYTFQLPQQVAVPPYDHIELGWNPQGHDPAPIYTLPHFDLHFYMVSSAEQAAVPFLAPVVNGRPVFDLVPAAGYLPSGYQMGPGLVPNMGAHSLDMLAPEFNGGVFTRTFIYGSYQGHITFLEPMFTLAYLQTLGSETVQIRQPQLFERAGYYPTSYTISYDDSPKQYQISLNNLTYHRAN